MNTYITIASAITVVVILITMFYNKLLYKLFNVNDEGKFEFTISWVIFLLVLAIILSIAINMFR